MRWSLFGLAVSAVAAISLTLAGGGQRGVSGPLAEAGVGPVEEDAPGTRGELSDAEWARLRAGEPLHGLELFRDRVVVVLCFQHW